MRYLPGWAVGALSTGALVGAFFLGSHLAAADLTPTAPPATDVTTLTTASRVATPVSYRPAATYRPATAARSERVRTASVSRAPVSRPRSVKKSVVIIAGSAAAGAVIGGLTKGKKGAVIGGLIGGGAATVWDQITRHKANRDR